MEESNNTQGINQGESDQRDTTKFIPTYIKKHTFANGSSVLNAAIKISELIPFADNEGWVRVTISERQSVGAKGQTHYMKLDTWKPQPQQPQQPAEQPKQAVEQPKQTSKQGQLEDINVEDIPF